MRARKLSQHRQLWARESDAQLSKLGYLELEVNTLLPSPVNQADSLVKDFSPDAFLLGF